MLKYKLFSHRPVSAYALFFRDTQAAIKRSSPRASFGDISKRVAALWDALDPDTKAVRFSDRVPYAQSLWITLWWIFNYHNGITVHYSYTYEYTTLRIHYPTNTLHWVHSIGWALQTHRVDCLRRGVFVWHEVNKVRWARWNKYSYIPLLSAFCEFKSVHFKFRDFNQDNNNTM